MATESEPVHDIPLHNPNSIPISDPPETPSPSPSQQPPQPPPSTDSMPPPYTTAPVSIPPPPATAPLPPKSTKRSLECNAQIQDSGYFKIRAVLKDLRPHFLEVVRAEDFRDCQAADELRERLKLLMELYKQMTSEGVTITKCRNASENGAAQKPEQLPADDEEAIDLEVQSCYIGGSAFGWNFITFAGCKAVYYGRTKESFRAAQAAL